MDRIINRRRLVAGAAALPIAAVVPSTTHAETITPTSQTKPDLCDIPGIDQFHGMLMLMIVTTPDGRGETVTMAFRGEGQVDISLGDVRSQLPTGGLESLPTWMQKQIGYAAMTTTDPREQLARMVNTASD